MFPAAPRTWEATGAGQGTDPSAPGSVRFGQNNSSFLKGLLYSILGIWPHLSISEAADMCVRTDLY